MQREPEAAMPIAEASLAMFRAMNHQPGIAQALNVIGELARIGGDDDRAKRAYEECLAVCQQTGEALRTCYNLVNLAYVAQHEEDHERALDLVRQALQLSRDTIDTRDIASFLVTFAGSIAVLGQLQRAAQLLGASEIALERMELSINLPTGRRLIVSSPKCASGSTPQPFRLLDGGARNDAGAGGGECVRAR